MEEIEELRAKAIASMPSYVNPNSSLKGKSPESREEGELSSGEDAELPTCSTAPSDRAAMDEPTPATVCLTQSLKADDNIPTSSSRVANMQLRTSVPRNYSNRFKTKQVQFKSSNNQTLCWHGKGSDDNLVISFSDDDSGSDSEGSELEKNVNGKDNTFKVDKSQMPIAPAQTQPEVLRGPPSNRTKLLLKKTFVRRAAIPSITKIHGGRLVASSVEKDPHTQRHNPVNKSSASQEHVRDANLADHKVESLRHQIALRENELKVQSKSMPQSMERTTGSYSNHRGLLVMKPDNQAAVINRHASVPTMGSASDERPMKRIKLDEHSKNKQCSDDQLQMQMPSVRSTCELRKESKDKNAMGCHEGLKEFFLGRLDLQPGRGHQEADKNVSISFKALNGVKDTESLLPTTSSTLRDLEVPYKHDNIFAGDISYHHQSGKKAIPVDSSTLLNQQMEPNLGDGALHQNDMPIHRNSSSESPRHSSASRGADVPDLLQTKATCKCNLTSTRQIVAKTVPLETSNDIFKKYFVHVPNCKLGNNEINISGMGSMQLESLAKLEELEDKELEEAQEHRHRCELEERRALKAYRKAQRTLVDANERCTLLYRKRELFSAQRRAFIMEASSSMWPSSWQNQKGTALDSVKNVSNASFDLLSRLGHQMPAEGQIVDRLGYDHNNQCSDGAPLDASSPRMPGHVFGSDQCVEPDASTTEPRDNGAMGGIGAAASHSNMSSDDDDVNFTFGNRSVESRLANDIIRVGHGEKITDTNVEIERSPSSKIPQDYELLEAALRSKLVARLGMRTSSKINDVSNAECTVDKGADTSGENKKLYASLGQRSQEGGKKLTSDLEGIELSGRSDNQLTARSHGNIFSLCDQSHRNIGPEENSSLHKEFCRPSNTTVFSLPPSVLRSVSKHAKFILPGCCNELPSTEENCHTLRSSANVYFEDVPDIGRSTNGDGLRSARTGEMIPHMCDRAIDPFWPFCMFELRGKCNNEECSWQHVSKCIKGNLNHTDHSATSNSDRRISYLLTCGRSNGPLSSPRGLCHHIQSVPAYKIGSYLIKVDAHLSRSVLARSTWQYWQSGFCASFPLPFSVQRILSPGTPFLQFGDDPAGDDYSRNMCSWYLKSQDGPMKQFLKGLPDSEQSLEMALDLFDGKVYKPDVKKALDLLSRAIEADPNSVVLWVVYLHIFYRKEKGIGKDDMFFHAVQLNEDSYELWLMYINSRMQSGDRLNAYDYALALFCKRKVACDKERKYTSACILDIFLQMIDFLCMSGGVDKAIQRIYGLLPTAENSGDTLLSDVHSCLIVSDKCIFWVCCTYLVIYGKLPESIVRQMEFEKDLLFGIEWPSAQLTTERRDNALELIEVGMDNVVNHHRRDQTALRSLHFLAVSHVRCVATLEGLHCSTDLLVKYMELYPTCIELVLISARLQNKCTGNVLKGFEEALSNWPKENPGLQFLWNQYAEYALENGGFDFAEKLMSRWFQGYWRVKDPCSEILHRGGNVSCSSSELTSHVKSDGGSHSPLEDEAFGFLNLFLYQLLQKNLADARAAIDKALELAAPENYKHCAREQAAFIISNEPVSQSISSGLICSLLNGYFGDSRSSPMLQPLSRRYYQNMNPRIRQLITNMLGPVSIDFSLINSVLEACYGPLLIPEKFDEPKDLVDFVESLMEIAPANYELTLSVYRFTSRNFSGTDVTSNAVRFWASSLLVNSIFQINPVAPEHVWLEAANALRDLQNLDISLRFHQQAVSVYPFSIKLWKSYLELSRVAGNPNSVEQAAEERGVELGKTKAGEIV